ncbi:T-cell ecto-ADP-ribosyltransferase 2-like, partial [Channa argus]|uniref:T-cell ecto-ADP-ribosyltransferase 2-like n=1 Tax=Channa argus TaxID=215402 RepID=UPI0035209F32
MLLEAACRLHEVVHPDYCGFVAEQQRHSPLQSADRTVLLDMAEKAVDDMYNGCSKTMTEKVKKAYFEKENTGIFADKFNDHVRNNRSIYDTSFQFHSLHFWLTSAVQILNNNTKCVTTYRRTDLDFTGELNQNMRFGSFASSSYDLKLFNFVKKTCLKITN